MVQFAGKFKYDRHEHFDKYLEKIGIGFMVRKVILNTTPVFEVIEEGDTYTFKNSSSLKTTSNTFTLGIEYDDEFANGEKVKSVTVRDGNKLITTSKGKKGVTIITREFTDTELINYIKDEPTGAECVRYYKRM